MIKLIAAALLVCLIAGAALAEPVKGIVIATDRSVNCASLETIVKDVTAGCKTDQDRAIALYNFVVRMVYIPFIYDKPKEMQGSRLDSVTDPLKNFAVYGSGGCGIQSVLFATLCHAAGFETRQADPGFAHVTNEIKWAGKWHWMDVWLPAYLLDEKGEIIGYGEMMADKDMVKKAIADKRISENYMYNPGDIKGVYNATKWNPGGSGVRKVDYVENLTLRPGESCTWMWDNVGKWYWPEEQFACPAFKFPADKNAKLAFPYWEPYEKKIPGGPHPGGNHVYYRYYGNAIFETPVKLTKAGLEALGAKTENIAFEKDAAAAKGGAGTIEIAFDLPYIIADTQLAARGGLDKIEFSIDGGKTWLPGEQAGADEKGMYSVGLGKPNSKTFPKDTTSGQYKYLLRLGLKDGAALKELKVTNITMLNFYSRPWLETGKNNVTVTAANGDALAKSPLEIKWAWLEDWTNEKSFSQKVDKSGATAVIDVGGTKRPKMKSITITCPAQ